MPLCDASLDGPVPSEVAVIWFVSLDPQDASRQLRLKSKQQRSKPMTFLLRGQWSLDARANLSDSTFPLLVAVPDLSQTRPFALAADEGLAARRPVRYGLSRSVHRRRGGLGPVGGLADPGDGGSRLISKRIVYSFWRSQSTIGTVTFSVAQQAPPVLPFPPL
jgi:hypothetical protein